MTPTSQTPPPRVRVTSSRRGASAPPRLRVTSELEEQTELGEVYLDGLMRAQLRLSIAVGGIAMVALLGLPLLLVSVPGTRTLAFLGIPFPWLALTAGVFPGLWALARWYTRQAERVEADFVDAVGRD